MTPCKSVERYGSHYDGEKGQAGQCCRAEAVPFGYGEFVHEGPCCSDPECAECWTVLVRARVLAERNELLEALLEIREAVCSGMGSLPQADIARAQAAIEKAEGR